MKKRNMKKYLFKHHKEEMKCGGVFRGTYFLAFIGASVYYIQQSATFWQGVVGVLKALVWPAFLVHKLLGL